MGEECYQRSATCESLENDLRSLLTGEEHPDPMNSCIKDMISSEVFSLREDLRSLQVADQETLADAIVAERRERHTQIQKEKAERKEWMEEMGSMVMELSDLLCKCVNSDSSTPFSV